MAGENLDSENPSISPLGTRSKRAFSALLILLLGAAALQTVAGVFSLIFVEMLQLIPARVDEIIFATALHFGVLMTTSLLYLIVRSVRAVPSLLPKIATIVLLAFCVVSVDRVCAIIYAIEDDYISIYTRHPRRIYYHRLNATGFGTGRLAHTNALGFDDKPIPKKKTESEHRILFVGDSIAYGFSLKADKTISRVVERTLSTTRDQRIRTMNAGVSGYGTWQQRDLFEHEGIASKPDTVVLIFCINDVIDIIGIGRGVAIGAEMDYGLDRTDHWCGIWRAITYHRARAKDRQIADAQIWAQNDPTATDHPANLTSFDQIFINPAPPAVEEAWTLVLEDLTAIRRRCADIGASFILVYPPERRELSSDPRYQQLEQRLAVWAKSQKVPFIDTTPLYEAALKEGLTIDEILMDSIHPTAEMALRIGEYLALEIKNLTFRPQD